MRVYTRRVGKGATECLEWSKSAYESIPMLSSEADSPAKLQPSTHPLLSEPVRVNIGLVAPARKLRSDLLVLAMLNLLDCLILARFFSCCLAHGRATSNMIFELSFKVSECRCVRNGERGREAKRQKWLDRWMVGRSIDREIDR